MEMIWTEQEVDAMAIVAEMTILEHGYQREDGSWMTDEDMENLTDSEWVKIYFEIYPPAT